jgi:hypothetical protein
MKLSQFGKAVEDLLPDAGHIGINFTFAGL